VHSGTGTSSQVNTDVRIYSLLNSPRKFTVVYGISDVQPFVVFLVGPRSKSTSVNRTSFDSVGCTKTKSH
jgi:hypothetical protein